MFCYESIYRSLVKLIYLSYIPGHPSIVNNDFNCSLWPSVSGICGGLGGVMEGAAKGCYKAGGMTVGILPGEERGSANPFIHLAIPTGLGEGRNLLVVKASDVVLSIAFRFLLLENHTGKSVSRKRDYRSSVMTSNRRWAQPSRIVFLPVFSWSGECVWNGPAN